MLLGARQTLLNNNNKIPWICQLNAASYIPTEYTFSPIDTIVEVICASYDSINTTIPESTSGTSYIFSVSNNNLTSSQTGIGSYHAWSFGIFKNWHINSATSNRGIIGGCGNGSGDVHYWGIDTEFKFQRTIDDASPIFNKLTMNYAHPWLTQGSTHINNIEVFCRGGGTANTIAPNFPLYLFIHRNPNGTLVECTNNVDRQVLINQITFKSASTNSIYVNFKAAKKNNKIGMVDTITNKFFESIGNFNYGESGQFAFVS